MDRDFTIPPPQPLLSRTPNVNLDNLPENDQTDTQ